MSLSTFPGPVSQDALQRPWAKARVTAQTVFVCGSDSILTISVPTAIQAHVPVLAPRILTIYSVLIKFKIVYDVCKILSKYTELSIKLDYFQIF
jgi:hypothetical protein